MIENKHHDRVDKIILSSHKMASMLNVVRELHQNQDGLQDEDDMHWECTEQYLPSKAE